MTTARILALVLAGLVGTSAAAMSEDYQAIELSTPRALNAGETVQLRIAARLQRGARIKVTTDTGRDLAIVAPFGQDITGSPVRATIPVPNSVMTGGRLNARVQVIEPGLAPRPPRPGEIERIDLVTMPRN